MPATALSRAAARVVESDDDGMYLDDQVWARLEALVGLENLGPQRDLRVCLRPRVLAGQASSLCDGHGSTP